MKSITIALAATAVVVAANKIPAADDHQKVYTTVFGGGYAQNIQPVAVQPVSVVQNAGAAEPTVTETVTNGASGKVLSLGSAMLAGAALLSYF
ncbi:hypothetical protein LPJ73_004639 [Coemansia sp. RSA 2703]|nr:hypothetical protein LPJ73_004639 [Coemansia sp. RSA 2703]KAJ2364432.1 hypothetical protein IW150_006476 [Coemansia sp. RSA 2607]KAJ2390482.1 hypothetical protein GGI05_003207 [Coemansia sp. RSA 2603]